MSNKKRILIMSGIVSTYRKLLELPLSVLVKNNPIPAQPIEELQLNINQPILYVSSFAPFDLKKRRPSSK